MNVREAVRSASREILVHKLRSLLSFSAIAVGAASLLYTMAQTRGMQEASERHMELSGPGPLTIAAQQGQASKKGLSRGLDAGDAAAVRAHLPELYMVSPQVESWTHIAHGSRRIEGVRILGLTPEWARRNWVYSLRGRFISDRDLRDAARVAIMVEPGGWVKKPFWMSFWGWESDFHKLMKRRDMLGERVLLGSRQFLVVGVLKPPPMDKDPRWNRWHTPDIIVPLSSFQQHIDPRGGTIDSIALDTGDERLIPSVTRRVQALIKARHRGEDDFAIQNGREELENELKEQRQYVLIGLVLGLVALLSGGIGILNVTLAAVYSRVREIGIRRSLGAERADIVALFLAEAVLLGLAGGAAGSALGIYGIDTLAKAADRDVIELAWHHVAAMIVVSAATAAAFAAFPAWRASRLDPVEALREEP